ncbi:MAG: hypothetical protein ICV78_17140 [Tolypothrix sp. Co-bin9]|nr:hypothetical protein [Tolypothrix sp. Co-bin9]
MKETIPKRGCHHNLSTRLCSKIALVFCRGMQSMFMRSLQLTLSLLGRSHFQFCLIPA